MQLNSQNSTGRIQNSDHHIGDFYRKNGLSLDLETPESVAAQDLSKLVNYICLEILKDAYKDDDSKIERIKDDQNLGKSPLMIYKQFYGDNVKQRSLASMDLLDEANIKAIAVSILAETNGNSQIAYEILTTSGLEIIKSMSKRELDFVKADLQTTSTHGHNEEDEDSLAR